MERGNFVQEVPSSFIESGSLMQEVPSPFMEKGFRDEVASKTKKRTFKERAFYVDMGLRVMRNTQRSKIIQCMQRALRSLGLRSRCSLRRRLLHHRCKRRDRWFGRSLLLLG